MYSGLDAMENVVAFKAKMTLPLFFLISRPECCMLLAQCGFHVNGKQQKFSMIAALVGKTWNVVEKPLNASRLSVTVFRRGEIYVVEDKLSCIKVVHY